MWSIWALKSRADLRQRWLQVLVLASMIVAGSAALTLAFSVDRSTAAVFHRFHEDASGAHVWVFSDDEPTASAAEDPAVEAAGDIIPTLDGDLIYRGENVQASVWGLARSPSVASPALLREGRWTDAARADEIVIDAGLAGDAGIAIGDTVMLVARNSLAATYEVVGIATPTFRVRYPEQLPALAFVSSTSIDDLTAGDPQSPDDIDQLGLGFAQGFRLTDPDTAGAFLDAQSDGDGITWQQAREDVLLESAGPPTMLRVFAIYAVLASGFVVAVTVANHAFSQQREIALFKAVGLTPAQLTLLFLGQVLAIAVASSLIGIAIGVLITPLFQWSITELLDAPAARSIHWPALAAVFVGVQVLAILSAALPAARAGSTSIVEAIALGRRQTGGRSSITARLMDRLRFPAFVVVGVKDTFSRPWRDSLTLAAIIVAVATLMMTFTFNYSLQRLTDNPQLIGSKPYELQANRLPSLTAATPPDTTIPDTPIAHEDARDIVASHPAVSAFVTDRSSTNDINGIGVVTRAIDGDVAEMGYVLSSGRLFSAPGEAIIGLGLAQQLDLSEGDRIDAEVLPGQPVTFTIVGRYFADENDGNTLMHSLGDLRAIDPNVDPGDFDLKLASHADRDGVILDIESLSEGRLVVTDLTGEADANLRQGRTLIAPMTILGAGLAVLAAANLLSSLVFSIRERTPQFGVLKSVGFTPLQVVAAVLVGVVPLALVGTIVGAPLGYWAIDQIMRSSAEPHQPADIMTIPSAPWLVALVAITLAISFLGALIPAIRAGRLGVSESLRAE